MRFFQSTLIFSTFFSFIQSSDNSTDPNGYIIFCPCMGRFGNQIDQFLGVLSFARTLDRTLVLPNFIEFQHPNTKMIPFESIFQVSTIAQYTKVVTMNYFKLHIMPKVWKPEKRFSFCWMGRKSIYDVMADIGCHPKEGSPFGPYWDHIGVDFIGDQYFDDIPGGYNTNQMGARQHWLEKFPSEVFPVLAFSSPPAPFPSSSNVWNIQKYLKWTSRITLKAKSFIESKLKRPFIGVHLRNDADWARVCDHINEGNRPLFASEQCLGENHYKGVLTREMCSPSKTTILNQIVRQSGNIGAKSIFVSSDKDFMIDDINEALKPYDIKAYRLNPDDMYISLAILARSDLFIGNCVSTFSHIVKRERDYGSKASKTTRYFGVVTERKHIDL